MGNAAFVRDFNLRVPDSWRLHSDTDVITYLPRGLGYAHVGVGVKFGGGGKLIVGLFGERRCDVDVSGICADQRVRCSSQARSRCQPTHGANHGVSVCTVYRRTAHLMRSVIKMLGIWNNTSKFSIEGDLIDSYGHAEA